MALLFLFSGCNFAPRYTQPELNLPTSWRTESAESTMISNVRWWETFEDSVLNQLIQIALENNKDLQVAIWRVREFYAQYQVVRSSLFPEIDLGAGALKQRVSPNANTLTPGTNPISPLYDLGFNLSYEVDFWGKIRNESFAAFSEYLAQIENRRTVILTLVGGVAGAYILLRQLDLQYIIALKTFESRKESLQIARYRFEGGLTSEIDVAQAASVYEEALAQVKLYEIQIPQQENLLSVLLGQSPSDILRGKSIDELTLPNEVPTGLPSDLLTRRPDILRAENNLIAANAQIGVARAAFFPQISLTGIYGWESLELHNLLTKGARMWQMGSNLMQVLFSGGRLTGQLKVAKAKKEELVYTYQQTILNALREVDNALIAHKKSKEIANVESARVNDLKLYLELAWERYYEGETQYLTVLDAERQLFAAQITLAQAQSEQFLTLVDLYKALGGGWVIDADQQGIQSSTHSEN